METGTFRPFYFDSNNNHSLILDCISISSHSVSQLHSVFTLCSARFHALFCPKQLTVSYISALPNTVVAVCRSGYHNYNQRGRLVSLTNVNLYICISFTLVLVISKVQVCLYLFMPTKVVYSTKKMIHKINHRWTQQQVKQQYKEKQFGTY